MKRFVEKKDGDYDITLRVIDQTSIIEEKDWDKSDLFIYIIAKKLYILTEETGIPIAPISYQKERIREKK